MQTRLSKNFITIALTMILTLGGLSFLWGQSRQADEVAVSHAQAVDTTQSSNETEQSDQQSEEYARPASFEEAYRAGYRDGRADCAASHSYASASARVRNVRRTAPRRGVAGARYYAERRRGHSTRDLILTIAAPAAIAAGFGGIVGGKKGAGIGALLGGGGGAAYYLYKNRRRR
ncbi:MAG TPA: hypothetical protein VID27_16655 [Blastocatellia bacterium]